MVPVKPGADLTQFRLIFWSDVAVSDEETQPSHCTVQFELTVGQSLPDFVQRKQENFFDFSVTNHMDDALLELHLVGILHLELTTRIIAIGPG